MKFALEIKMCKTNLASDGLKKRRIIFLDEARGLCIVCMVFFHMFFDLAYIFNFPLGYKLYNFFLPAQPFFAGAFLAICGICCRLSRSNFKRSGIIAAAAAAVTVVTIVLSKFNIVDPIYFGILHLLAVSVFTFAILHPLFDKINPIVGIAVCAALSAILWDLSSGEIGIGGLSFSFNSNTPELIALPFGIGSTRLYASDYFPIFPWILIFFAGTFLGRYFASDKLPEFFYKNHLPPLSGIGRHSLIIYILHQPIIYGLLMLINYIIGRIV